MDFEKWQDKTKKEIEKSLAIPFGMLSPKPDTRSAGEVRYGQSPLLAVMPYWLARKRFELRLRRALGLK